MSPNYRVIYEDLIKSRYPYKLEECRYILQKKKLSNLDVINLNQKIFGNHKETISINQKFRSYSESDIFEILKYQKKNGLNNLQLAKHFTISRNTIAKWKRTFYHIQ